MLKWKAVNLELRINMAYTKKKKSPFEDLDADFKSSVENMKDEEIKQKLAQLAIAEHENREAKKNDLDLQEKQAQAKEAGRGYREASKGNRLSTEYCYEVLSARGKL
jgi:hypothetical protein